MQASSKLTGQALQVLVGSGEASIERSQFIFDFDLERRMLAEGQQSSRAGYSGQVCLFLLGCGLSAAASSA